MEKGIMFGLIGMGVAILVAVIFVVLVLAGPSIKEKQEEKQAATAASAVIEAIQGLESKIAQGGVQRRDVDTIIAKLNTIQDDVSTVKSSVQGLETKPASQPATSKPAGIKFNFEDPINSLTKENCDDAETKMKDLVQEAEDTIENVDGKLNDTEKLIDTLRSRKNNETNTTLQDAYQKHIDTLKDWEIDLDDEKEEWEDKLNEREDTLTDVEDECE
ncbi:hypothetical protein HYS48_00545, partial [Candidatus Woesearchaeota archaeon]|nr:hypothetical protein [Candidatus Woesearchaeota archaeon]